MHIPFFTLILGVEVNIIMLYKQKQPAAGVVKKGMAKQNRIKSIM